jgi:DNA primase large subunit
MLVCPNFRCRQLLSIKIGTADLAKYPFLNEASEYIRETHFDFQEFNRPEMKHIIERAADRLEREVAKGLPDEKLDRYDIEILTFLVTLMMVKSLGMEPIFRKHSLLEAMRVEKFLTEDLVRERNEEKRRLLLSSIFEELFGVNVGISEDDARFFKVKVTDYLMRASHFHEQEWKLINRLVHKGFVYLDADETVRLIRSELGELIYSRVKSMTLPILPETIKTRVNELSAKFAPQYYQYRRYRTQEYPPCIKHALEEMNKGENLPHSARMMLATYMLAIGKSIEEIVLLYQNAPDYKEKVTRYQVEHLAGLRGSGTKYSVPSCQKLLTENLCFATEECNGIRNPVQFGRRTNPSKELSSSLSPSRAST